MGMSNEILEADLSCMLTPTFSVVSVTVATVVCVVTIFGNILILLSIYKYPTKFKGSLYILIGNLAVVDLLLGIWMLLFTLEEIFPELKQIWSFCVAKPTGILVSYGCSILTLLGISLDRFNAVMFPLKHLVKTYKRKYFLILISGMWFLSITAACSLTIFPNLKSPDHSFVCRIGIIIPPEFDVTAAIILLVALFLNSILYGVVIWKIKHMKTQGNITSKKKQTKTVQMIIIFVVFVICWMPFIICSILLKAGFPVSVFEDVLCAREYLTKLGYINSSLNWIIYGLTNKKFQAAFKKILCCNIALNSPSFAVVCRGRRVIDTPNSLRQSLDQNFIHVL